MDTGPVSFHITALLHGVFSGVFPEAAVVFLVVQLAAAQRLVDVQIVLGHIDDAAGDVGTVVGGALQIRQQVCPRLYASPPSAAA